MEKKSIIWKSEIQMLNKILSEYKPYESNDPEYALWDNPNIDNNRLRATTAKRVLDEIKAHPEKYIIK